MEPADLTATILSTANLTKTERSTIESSPIESSTEALITRHRSVQKVGDLAL